MSLKYGSSSKSMGGEAKEDGDREEDWKLFRLHFKLNNIKGPGVELLC